MFHFIVGVAILLVNKSFNKLLYKKIKCSEAPVTEWSATMSSRVSV